MMIMKASNFDECSILSHAVLIIAEVANCKHVKLFDGFIYPLIASSLPRTFEQCWFESFKDLKDALVAPLITLAVFKIRYMVLACDNIWRLCLFL
jgi:hypothetical protein